MSMEPITGSEQYGVLEIDDVEIIVYLKDADQFATGDDDDIKIEHVGDLEFRVGGMGNGQRINYHLVSITEGYIAEVVSTGKCEFDWCRMGIDVNFDGDEGTVTGGEYSYLSGRHSDENPATFYSDSILLTFGARDEFPHEPEDWHTATDNPDVSANLSNGVSGPYCAGDTIAAEVEIINQVVAGDTTATVEVTNLMTGSTSTDDVTVPPNDTKYTAEVTVPDDVNGKSVDVISISVDGEQIYTGSADVGASFDSINITSANVPDSVMLGREYNGSMVVENASDCDVNVTASYTEE
jgi:hypothetical protein